MKRQAILFIALGLIFSYSIKAQEVGTVTITIADVIEQPGIVNIPVSADIDVADPGVGSIELIIDYDTGVLTDFLNVINIAPELSAWGPAWGVQDPADPGQFKISFAAADTDDYITSFSDVLFYIQFDYAGDYSDISFVNTNQPGGSEVGQDGATPIDADFVDGSITQAPPIPIALWSLLIAFGLISFFKLRRDRLNR